MLHNIRIESKTEEVKTISIGPAYMINGIKLTTQVRAVRQKSFSGEYYKNNIWSVFSPFPISSLLFSCAEHNILKTLRNKTQLVTYVDIFDT